jgi:hypothetical protein
MQNNLISILIINYKQKNLLLDCVNSIYGIFKSNPFEVIIINNSPEENLHALQSEYENLKIIDNQNLGFAQANNLGAGQSDGNYLLFLNCDTLIKNDFLQDLLEYFRGNEFGAVGLKMQNLDGSFQISCYEDNTIKGEILNKKTEKEFRNRNISFMQDTGLQYQDVVEVDWVSGAAFFMKKDVFENIGGFDERYFLFYEDADICKRLSDKGYDIYFYPYSKIVHLKGENVNEEFESKTYYFSKQSQILYYKLHNNLLERITLRIYLFSKFLLLSLFTFKKINFEIFKLALGIRK